MTEDQLQARIEALETALRKARRHVVATNGAEHMMEGFGPRKRQPSDALLEEIEAALAPSQPGGAPRG